MYIWIEGIAAPWDGENVTYEFGDTVKWGGTDALGNVIEVDSLLYIYNVENQTDDLLGNIILVKVKNSFLESQCGDKLHNQVQ